jgi:hypothetical protein
VLRQIAPHNRSEDEDRPCAWLHPLNLPWQRPDGGLDITGPLHVSDGPIYLDALRELVIGRVVGLMERLP